MLSEKQGRSIAEANGTINIWDGAVRSGKTVASLLRWAEYVPTAPRGGDLVVTGKTHDTIARNIFNPLMDPMLMGPAARSTHYTRGAPTGTILGRNVEVISGNDAKSEGRLRGMTCVGAYVDEGSLLPEQFFDQLVARMLSIEDAMMFVTTNPGAPNHWLRKRYILKAWRRVTGVRHWHFVLADNPILKRRAIDRLKALYQGLWYKRMILGQWVMAEGAIFDMFDEDRHIVKEIPPITRWLSVGVDHGVRNPFAALVCGLGVDGKLHLTNEYRYSSAESLRQLTDVEYSARLRSFLAGVPIPQTSVKGIAPEIVAVDPSATSFREQLHRDGVTSWPATNDVGLGLSTMASLMAADLIDVHESCEGFINEIPGYSWDDKKTDEDAPIKVDDHSLDGGRYAVATSRHLWLPRMPALNDVMR